MRKIKRVPEYVGYELSDAGEMLRYFSSSRGPYTLSDYRRGFSDHRARAKSAPAGTIRRLFAAYHKAKQDEKLAPALYRLRGEWEHILEVEYANFLRCLRGGDENGLTAMLANFCRNECSRGLAMSSEYMILRRRPLYGFRYIREFNEHYADWRKASARVHAEKELVFPEVGNPVGMMTAGGVVPYVNMRHRYYADRLIELAGEGQASIAEIGGGFGGLGYFLLKDGPGRLRYANFDLPEMNVVNGYFFLNAFPDRKIVLYGESDAPVERLLERSDAVIYPHFTFRGLTERSVDVVFNSCSFSEMDEQMVREYFSHIERICRGRFLHVNHDIDRVYNKATGQRHVKLSGFSLPEASFRTVHFKRPVFFHPKYFEYLYERI